MTPYFRPTDFVISRYRSTRNGAKMAQDVFAARLERLHNKHSQIDLERQAAAKSMRGRYPEWVSNLGYPGSLLAAGIIGLFTVVMSRYAMFHINGVPGEDADADITMLMDGALAAAIAFVIRNALNMNCKEHLAFKAAGIWIALTCMHNLVHAYPKVWEIAFSPEWVQYTTELTEPKSIYISGMSFLIGGEQDDTSPFDERATPAAGSPKIKINRY